MYYRPLLAPCAAVLALVSVVSIHAADPLAAITSRAELDQLIETSTDAALKKALSDHAAQIEAALKRKPDRDRVMALLDSAKASHAKGNDTPAALAKALGGPSPLFDFLRGINLAGAALTVKERRQVDPFDAAFYESVATLPGLEELTIVNTTAENAWLAPLAKLKSLKTLRIINQAKLDDTGLALLAPLHQLESFGYIGTRMTGAPLKDFKGWTSLKSLSHRGSKLSDAGLKALVAAFPNLESLSLAHGDYGNDALAEVATLTKLKGLELGSHKSTPEGLAPLTGLKLEYLQLAEGFEGAAALKIVEHMPTIRKLVLTNCVNMTDDDLRTVVGMKNVRDLELSNLAMPAERVAVLKDASHLESLRIRLAAKAPGSEEDRSALKAALPLVTIKIE